MLVTGPPTSIVIAAPGLIPDTSSPLITDGAATWCRGSGTASTAANRTERADSRPSRGSITFCGT
jgi:hypothetical protein